MANCENATGTRKRLFWATQSDACGATTNCGQDCGSPGLTFDQSDACGGGCDITIPDGCVSTPPYRSISTNGWVEGLVINMLMTDGREPDTECGVRPGSNGGHWSESYISDSTKSIGTLMRTLEPVGRMMDQVNTVVAYAQATLERLVERGVASAVEVNGVYLGDARMRLDILIKGRASGDAKVSVSGTQQSNSWVWGQ